MFVEIRNIFLKRRGREPHVVCFLQSGMREKRGQTPLKGGGHDAGEERGMQKTWSREIDQMETGIDISS